MTKRLLIVAGLFVFSLPAAAQGSGPFGGNFKAIAIDPSNPATIYVGSTVGGIFKTTTGGTNWTSATAANFRRFVRAVAIDPANPTTVYAGTVEGIFRSTDSGTTWTLSNTGLGVNTDVQDLAVDPSNPATIYAATTTGMFKSIDGAANWASANSGLTSPNLLAVIVDSTNTMRVYATTNGGGIFKSPDGGMNWTPINTGLTDLAIQCLAVDPGNGAIVYAGSTVAGLFKSTDGGLSWNAANSGFNFSTLSIRALAMHPSAANTIYAATFSGVYKSTNAAGTWTPANTGITVLGNLTPGAFGLAIDPATPSTVYVTTLSGGGIFKTTNAGANWTAVRSGLSAAQISGLAIVPPQAPSTFSTVYAATTEEAIVKSNVPSIWSSSNFGFNTVVTLSLAVDPVTPSTLYAGTSARGVFKSTNNGVNWAVAGSGISLPVRALAVDPSGPSVVYAGTFGGGVYKTSSGGSNWVTANGGLASLNVQALVIHPASTSTVYAGTDSGLFKSTDAGSNWALMVNGLTNANVLALAIDPLTPTTVYAGTNDGLFKSADAGANWALASTGISSPRIIHAITIDPTNPSIVYVGKASQGLVWKTTNGGSTWTNVSSGLPAFRTFLSVLAVDPSSPSTVYAGTDSSGVFVSSNGGAGWQPTGGGFITGKVTDAASGAPLAGVQLTFSGPGFGFGGFLTDSAGNYSANLPAASWLATTQNSAGYVNEVYEDTPCSAGSSCDAVGGTPVVVAQGTTTAGIDFGLAIGGRISGTVTDSATGTPLSGVSISVSEINGSSGGSAVTNSSGVYTLANGLPAGSYYATTSNSLGYVNEVYDDVACAGCSIFTGGPIAVTVGSITTGIDFGLAKGGSISGTVTDADTGAGLSSVSVRISGRDRALVASALTNSSGAYVVGAGLPTASYFVSTSNGRGYADETYDDTLCTGGPNCDPTKGMLVSVATGSTTSGNDFGLKKGGAIGGVVTDALTGAPIVGASVLVYDSTGVLVTSGTTNISGSYATPSSLPTGTYYAVTSNSSGYIDKLYDNTTCAGCPVTAGVPISVSSGSTTNGIDFGLEQGGRITGTVTDSATGNPVNLPVGIYNQAGGLVTLAFSAYRTGSFASAPGLPTGTYYALVSGRSAYVNKLWNGITCIGCPVTMGTPISVTKGATTAGINFAVDSGGRISGFVTAVASGAALPGATVQIYDGNGAFIGSGMTGSGFGSRSYFVSVPAGSYYARTNVPGYVDKLWNGIDCPGGSCNVTSGTPILVPVGLTQGGIDFALAAGTTVTATITSSPANAAFVSSGSSCAPGSYSTPTSLLWASNMICSVDFASPQTIGGTQYVFNGFSVDGGPPTMVNPLTLNSGTGARSIHANFSPVCTYSLSPVQRRFTSDGGLAGFTVQTAPPCAWGVAPTVPWVQIVQPLTSTRFQGNGQVAYTVAPNTSFVDREGMIGAAGQAVTIQQGHACLYSVSPSSTTIGASGGTKEIKDITVTSPSGCPWTASSNQAWLTVTQVIQAPSGGGVATIKASKNLDPARSATVTIAGRTVLVTQKAAAPPPTFCGSVDVTSKLYRERSDPVRRDLFGDIYSQEIRIYNLSSTETVNGPLYLVLEGAPTHDERSGHNTTLLNPPPLTTCFSPQGDYLMPLPGGDMPPKTNRTFTVNWLRDYPFGPSINWSWRVLGGHPTK